METEEGCVVTIPEYCYLLFFSSCFVFFTSFLNNVERLGVSSRFQVFDLVQFYFSQYILCINL